MRLHQNVKLPSGLVHLAQLPQLTFVMDMIYDHLVQAVPSASIEDNELTMTVKLHCLLLPYLTNA